MQQTRFQLISLKPSDSPYPVVDFRAETPEQKQTWIIALRKILLEVEVNSTAELEREKISP